VNKEFKKRPYRSFGELWADLRFIFSNYKKLHNMKLISPDFRERLMLAVTAVYGCRYCSYFHTREALKTGVNKEEIARILSGDVGSFPEEEDVALLYAQHWADSNADPDPEAVKGLIEAYGDEKAEAINLVLRMNRIGNLLGNSLDYLLYKLSFWQVERLET